MKVDVETITPKMAEEYLKHNKINRALKDKRVTSYANDMKDDAWQLNGEAIRFNNSGDLIDGQHRLNAIIRANKPIQMVVMRGINDTVSVYDRGVNRNVTDSLILEGLDKSIANNKWVSVAKLHFYVQRGRTVISDNVIKEFLIENCDHITTLNKIIPNSSNSNTSQFKVSCRNSVFALALYYAYLSGEKTEKLREFIDVFSTGFYDNASQTSAVVLRNDFIAGNLTAIGGNMRKLTVFKYEKAISDFCKGYSRKKSYNSIDFPTYSNNKIFEIK